MRTPTRALGILGLIVLVACSMWIAAGAAAGGGYLLELPGGGSPNWIAGPLHGLGASIGPLGSGAFTIAVSVLVLGYLITLTTAGQLPFRVVLAAVIAANLAFTLGPTLVSTDVFGYISYARLEVIHGLNPYLAAPAAAPHDPILTFVYWRHATSPYGPLFTIASAPLGLLSSAAALWIYKALAGLASVATAMLVARLASERGLNPARAAAFVGLNPALLLYAVSGAHNDLLAVLLVVAALALTLHGREAGGAGAVLAAAAVKLTLGLALPFVVIGSRRRLRALAGAAVASAVIGLVTVGVFGSHVFDQLQRITTDHQFDTAWSGPDRLASMLGTGIDSGIRGVCTLLAAVAALGAIVWAWRGGDWVTAAGWAVLALIASIASLAPWYLVWVLPLAALGRARALRLGALAATGYLIAVHLPGLGGQPWLSAAG